MKRFWVLFGMLICSTVFAQTININWIVDGQQYGNSTTCEYSGDVILPTPPTKYGYTFAGWEPGNYIFLEYIESTGTQWIDTGIIFYNNADYLRFSLKAQITTAAQQEKEILSNDTNAIRGFNVGVNQGSLDFYCFNSPWVSSDISIIRAPTNNTGFLELSGYFSNKGFFCDSVETQKTGTYTTHNNQSILIGSRRGLENTASFIGKIYYVKISLDNTLVRDFVPAIRVSDNTVGMYDTVTGTFFGNSGTGSFIAGPVAQ